MASWALVGCGSWVLVGCSDAGDGAPTSTLAHRTDTVGGITVMHSSGRAPEWTLEPLLSLGSEAAVGDPAPDEFGQITSVVTDDDGDLWVADAQNHEIRVFAPDGALLRRIGREGQGPGEFLSLYSLAWVGDTLLALDFGNGRIGELSPQGEWLGTRPAPGRVSGPASMLRLYAVSDTQVYQWSIKQVDGQVRRTWVEQGIDGVGEEWVQQTPTAPEPTTVVCDRPDGAISFFDVPFGGKMLEHPAGAGDTWVAWSPDYQLALVAPDGDTLRLVERAWDPLPILDAEWDSATVEFEDFREEWPDAGCRPSAPPRPEMKTALRNLLVDTEGRLWVEIYTETGTAWEVFDPSGALRGRVEGFSYDERVAPSIRQGLVAWVSRDSLGVQRAHTARVRESGRE